MEKACAAYVAFPVGAQAFRGKDVGDRWETIACLSCGNVVDVGSIREVGWMVGDVTGEGMRLMSPRKGLIQRSGLNYSLMCELFVRWCHDTESWRCLSF